MKIITAAIVPCFIGYSLRLMASNILQLARNSQPRPSFSFLGSLIIRL